MPTHRRQQHHLMWCLLICWEVLSTCQQQHFRWRLLICWEVLSNESNAFFGVFVMLVWEVRSNCQQPHFTWCCWEVLSNPEQDHFFFLICHVCGFLGEIRSNREQHLSFTFVVMFTFVCWFAGKFCQVPIHTACLHPHTGHPCRVQQPMPLRVQAAAMVYKTVGNPQNCVTQHGGVIPRVI